VTVEVILAGKELWDVREEVLWPGSGHKLGKVKLADDDQGYHFAARLDDTGEIIGVVSLFPYVDKSGECVLGVAQLRKFAVKEQDSQGRKTRGQGIGKLLVQELLRTAARMRESLGIEAVFCTARSEVQGFYEKNEFHVVPGEVPKANPKYPEGGFYVDMVHELSHPTKLDSRNSSAVLLGRCQSSCLKEKSGVQRDSAVTKRGGLGVTVEVILAGKELWDVREEVLWPGSGHKLGKVKLADDDQGYHFAARLDDTGEIIGVVSLFPYVDKSGECVLGVAQLRKFAVKEQDSQGRKTRGQGIGKLLVQELLRTAARMRESLGIEAVFCTARSEVQGFYEKNEFHVVPGEVPKANPKYLEGGLYVDMVHEL